MSIWNSRRSGAGRADSWFNLNRPPVSPAPFSSSPQRSGASPRPENAQLGTGMTEQAPTPTTTYVSGGPYTTGQEHIGPGGRPLNWTEPTGTRPAPIPAPNQDTWPRNENTTPAPPTAPTPGQIAGQPAPATVAPTPTPPAAPQSTPATPPMTGSIDGGGNTSYTDQYGYPVDTTTGQPFPMNEQQLVTFFQQKVQNGSPFSAIDALRVRQWLPGAQGDALANAVLRAAAGFPFEYTMTQPPPPPPPPTGTRPPPVTRPTTPAAPPPPIMHRGQPQQSTPPVTTPGYRSVYDRQPISDLGAAANGVAGAMQGLPPVPEFRYPTVQRARPGGIFIR